MSTVTLTLLHNITISLSPDPDRNPYVTSDVGNLEFKGRGTVIVLPSEKHYGAYRNVIELLTAARVLEVTRSRQPMSNQ